MGTQNRVQPLGLGLERRDGDICWVTADSAWPCRVSGPFRAELLPLILFHLRGRSPKVEFPAPSACAHQPSGPFHHFPFTLWGGPQDQHKYSEIFRAWILFPRSLGSPKEDG